MSIFLIGPTGIFTASSNGNYIDIELEKLESFPVSISTSRYPATIQINNLEWDTSFVITEPIDILLPQGQYHLTATTDTGFPFTSDFFHNSSRVEDIAIYSRDLASCVPFANAHLKKALI